MISTYLIPDETILNLISSGNDAEAMCAWVLLPHRLESGERIRPRLNVALAMIDSVKAGLHEIPMCVCEGDYTIVDEDGYSNTTEIRVSGRIPVVTTKHFHPMAMVYVAASKFGLN